MELAPPVVRSWCIIEEAKRRLKGFDHVEVVIDRRITERRRRERRASAPSPTADRRAADRDRRRLDIDELLQIHGYAIVPRES